MFNKVHHSGAKQMDGFYLASLLEKACKSESKRLLHWCVHVGDTEQYDSDVSL